MSTRPKVSWLLLTVVIAAVTSSAVGWWTYTKGKNAGIISAGPTVIRLEKLSELATVRVHVADAMTGKDSKWYGDVKGAWIIKGDALVSIDLQKAKVVESNAAKKTITLCLPKPRVLQPRVDHEKTVCYDSQKGWFRSSDVESEMHKNVMKQAQENVERLANDEEHINLSRRQAETALTEIYGYIGWTVTIVWEDQKGKP